MHGQFANAKTIQKTCNGYSVWLRATIIAQNCISRRFLAELGEFLHLYNAENAQLPKKDRKSIPIQCPHGDMEEIVKLVDRFGSKLSAICW